MKLKFHMHALNSMQILRKLETVEQKMFYKFAGFILDWPCINHMVIFPSWLPWIVLRPKTLK